MSAALGRAIATARIAAAHRPGTEFKVELNKAFERIHPGEFDEVAVAEEAAIEQLVTTGGHLPIRLFIQDAEEPVDYSPDELRRLAFNLLAMADVSEVLFVQGGSGS